MLSTITQRSYSTIIVSNHWIKFFLGMPKKTQGGWGVRYFRNLVGLANNCRQVCSKPFSSSRKVNIYRAARCFLHVKVTKISACHYSSLFLLSISHLFISTDLFTGAPGDIHNTYPSTDNLYRKLVSNT